ncbi:MAG: glycosyl transferase family 1 [Methylothermaceae bacteria B42]|nr:MAG: glycosyl transferase family 1 [Methylothermaceae bacteria B42]HHJ39392.1 glycosyltransferase family 1 protein [Methylothermaceae bacterium]
MNNRDESPIHQLALVGPLPPPFGGMANQTLQLAEKLSAEGIEVEIIQWNREYWPRWIGKIPVIRAGFRLLPYLWALWLTAGRKKLFHIMANSGWSWHLFAAPAVWIASLRGCAIVLNYRGGEAESFFSRSFRYVKPTLNRCHKIIVPSGYLREVFARFGVLVDVVPNPVDLTKFGIKSQNEKSKNGPNLIVCRNLEPIYGIPCALRAFERILESYPNAKLWIAGSGPQEHELKKLAVKLGIANKVVFTGRLTPEQMVDLYRKAEIVLNPSEVDNAPNSLLEALAVGVPVVSTDAGGIPYLVEHNKTALLVPINDNKAMANSAIKILNDSNLRDALCKNGLIKAKEHSWDTVKEKLLLIYVYAVSNKSIARAGSNRRT